MTDGHLPGSLTAEEAAEAIDLAKHLEQTGQAEAVAALRRRARVPRDFLNGLRRLNRQTR